MSVLRHQVRPGSYHDSIVLMQLRATLAELPGIHDAASVMATAENLPLLAASGLLPPDLVAGAEDLVVVVRADTEEAAATALSQVDALLKRGSAAGAEYRPRSLRTALRDAPTAHWVLVSVPGRFAGRVAREALEAGRHVFLYSDNVPIEEEIDLKERACAAGRLLMGPDCGTTWINGVGFGFANRVRRGRIGLVGASGTGLQAVACHIHALGEGISHGIGTGGRDLSDPVGGRTTLLALEALSRDPETAVIAIVSKPPGTATIRHLAAAARVGKPVLAHFLGADASVCEPAQPALELCGSLGELARRAVARARAEEGARDASQPPEPLHPPPSIPEPALSLEFSERTDAPAPGEPGGRDTERTVSPPRSGRFLRGLFAGGSLALEALTVLRDRLPGLRSNLPLPGVAAADPARCAGHAVLDFGADELTVGRLHPMIDDELRVRRLAEEAAQPDVGVILFDVVLGDGAHPDPAAGLCEAMRRSVGTAITRRQDSPGGETRDGGPRFVAIVIGTEDDPQDLKAQIRQLEAAGATVFRDAADAARHAAALLGAGAVPVRERETRSDRPPPGEDGGGDGGSAGGEGGMPEARVRRPLDIAALREPVAAINVGLELFHESLLSQGAHSLQIAWQPPAGGDSHLASLLDRLRPPSSTEIGQETRR